MHHSSPLVIVILSTFNGARFLSEQLYSLINQSHKNFEIIVRDDGSEDDTCEILAGFSEEHGRVNVLCERNIGVVGSFFELLQLVPPEADYVALCDQDDVWGEDKIERALLVLGHVDPNRPALYCGALEVVDEKLNHIRVERLARRRPSLENALVQNVATGCATIINEAALRLVADKEISVTEILMHDWWLYQVVSAFGTVLYDDSPKIKYRQHGGNVIGSSSGLKLWVDRLKRQLGPNSRAIRRQATELLRAYGSDMCAQNGRLVGEFLSCTGSEKIGRRLAYAVRTPVHRQSRFDELILRILIVFSRI